MGCEPCADKLRKFILPEAGYRKVGDAWVDDSTGDSIPDTDVENHHTRLTLLRNKLRRAATSVALRAARKKAQSLADLLKGR